MNKEKDVIVSNVMWRFIDKVGTQLISFIISIVVSRLIDPESYGKITLINAFIYIFAIFTDFGLGDSLIQKKDVDELDYSTALIANISLCTIVYLVIFFLSPYVELFYEIDGLATFIRVSAISILISGYKNIQHCYVARNMLFKKYCIASIVGTVGAGIIGVYLAFNGYEAWSLIISNLFDVFVDTLICHLSVKWNISLKFSFERLKSLLNFGVKMLMINFIERVYSKISQLITGKIYSSEQLAFYDKGDSLTYKLTNNIDYAINAVLFPAMSKVQENVEKIKDIARQTLKNNTYIIYPLLIGLMVVADNAITVVFTGKWLDSVIYIRIFCLTRLMLPICTVNSSITKSLGESSLMLRQQTVCRVISLIILFLTTRISMVAIALGLLVSTIIETIIKSYANKKLINYGLIEQIKEIAPTLLISLIMGIIVYLLSFLSLNVYLKLFIQVLCGAFVYITLSIITKNESFYEILSMLKKDKDAI